MDSKFMDRLSILKVRFDLTYSKLALMIGVTDDIAGNYLSGRTKMPMDKVMSLSAALRIDSNWLLRGEGESPIKDLLIPVKSELTDLIDSLGTSDVKQSARQRFGTLTDEAIGLLFDEMQMLQDRLANLEQKINGIQN